MSSFSAIDDDLTESFKQLITNLIQKDERNIDQQRIVDFYTSYIDMKHRNVMGVQPIADDLSKVDAVKNYEELAQLLAQMDIEGLRIPYSFWVNADESDSSKFMIASFQNGISLEKKYYEGKDKAAVKKRENYIAYLSELLKFAQFSEVSKSVSNNMKVETALAKISWTPNEYYDLKRTTNPMSFKEVSGLMSNLDMPYYFDLKSYPKDMKINIAMPSYMKGLNELFKTLPLETWKDYLKTQIVLTHSDSLTDEFVEATLRYKTSEGLSSKLKPLDTRAAEATSDALSHVFGKEYIKTYFNDTIKGKVQTILHTIIDEYRVAIQQSDRLSEATKLEALKKLNSMHFNIAYPDQWKDFSTLKIQNDDLVSNYRQLVKIQHTWELAKLKRGTVDKDEWSMSPQAVNAYYTPTSNKFVLLAGILKPPFFDINSSDAANYGGIGLVIGHEIGHAFDNRGAQYDENGNLRNWWTEKDLAQFNELKDELITQADAYEILPGLFSNGELQIGEIMADLSGSEIALRAYLNTLEEDQSIRDQGTRDYFIQFAKIWRNKARPQERVKRNDSDPHPAGEYRVNGTVKNMALFHHCFDIKKSDPMYMAPKDRVNMW